MLKMFRMKRAIHEQPNFTDEKINSLAEEFKIEILIAIWTLGIAEKYGVTANKIIDAVLNSLEDKNERRTN